MYSELDDRDFEMNSCQIIKMNAWFYLVIARASHSSIFASARLMKTILVCFTQPQTEQKMNTFVSSRST